MIAWVAFVVSLLNFGLIVGAMLALRHFWKRAEPTVASMFALFGPPPPASSSAAVNLPPTTQVVAPAPGPYPWPPADPPAANQ